MDKLKVYGISSDPVYIGTGGCTIGRVDNTIVRDPITRIPKIPGSSFAGTLRFYVTLELQSAFKNEFRINPKDRRGEKIEDLFETQKDWIRFEGNRYALMKCAGQDDKPNEIYDNIDDLDAKESGHCGKCIVCKTFGYAKKSEAQQGIAFFSDLNILFFPVYTRLGVRWITSPQLLELAGINIDGNLILNAEEVIIQNVKNINGTINLGWLNLHYRREQISTLFSERFKNISSNDGKGKNVFDNIITNLVIVPDNLISQIINSNLEVRTSVSIDPITGAAKEKALFTSEAIPRATVFYGEIRLMHRYLSDDLPDLKLVIDAIKDSSKYYETLGIGGMTTRGFGRLKIFFE